MQNQKMFLTTGEFAQLCHTTKYTLFHYCDTGLFCPARTDENGYRYYHVLQYDTFMTISELRAIGMSLKEIRGYLEKRSPVHMLELYDRQEQLIDRQLARLNKIKSHVCCQKEKISQVIQCDQTYFTQVQPQSCLTCSDWITQRDDYAMTSAVGTLMTRSDASGAGSGMVCNLAEAVRSEAYPFCFYVQRSSGQTADSHIRQAGTYLCTYHYGDYEALHRTFRDLLAYADQQDMKLDDWVYAETIIGDWAVTQPQDYIIKVSVRITGQEAKGGTD